MAFDFRSAERVRRQAPVRTLGRRPDDCLPFLGTEASAGNGLLLDTCVYIDQMQGRAPAIVADLLAIRLVNHSTVAVQELMHTVGALDPGDARTEGAVAAIEAAIDAMPAHRLFVPDADILAQAAVYAGILARVQGYGRDERMKALHDCVLFVQAMKHGVAVLTRNVREFDALLQMRADGRVLFCRT
ncbi:DNA-binding protein [Methylobacterium sp. E-041]|nr:DNA-binding protein [Methylobacterium sp. E-041]